MPYRRTITAANAAFLLVLAVAVTDQLAATAAQSIYRPRPGGLRFNCSTPMTRLLGKAVTIGPENICKDLGMGNANVLTCTALDILNDLTRQVSGECRPHKQAPIKSVSATGEPIPQPLRDRRPLPAGKFADEKALMKEEAATHYWYITNVINLFLWAPCYSLKNFTTPYLIPEGWTLVHMESTGPQGAYDSPIPAYAVLKSADGKQLAVIIRGTRTAEEWQIDMTYAQAADPAGAYPGMLSKGFLFAARVLWPALEQVLLAEVVQGSVRDVTVAGHSLGAAMATMLSYRAQVYLDRKLAAAGKQPVAIGALLFAPPNVGDDTFVTDFNKKVNARRIAYVADIVPQVPCAPRMMACRNTIFQTAAPGVTSWNYGKVGGQITLTPDGMPIQPEVWSKTGEVNGCMMLPFALASHICSYTCYYSKAAGAAADGRCKLWGHATAADMPGTSFCMSYAFSDPEYPLRGHGSKLVIGSKSPDPTKHVEVIIAG